MARASGREKQRPSKTKTIGGEVPGEALLAAVFGTLQCSLSSHPAPSDGNAENITTTRARAIQVSHLRPVFPFHLALRASALPLSFRVETHVASRCHAVRSARAVAVEVSPWLPLATAVWLSVLGAVGAPALSVATPRTAEGGRHGMVSRGEVSASTDAKMGLSMVAPLSACHFGGRKYIGFAVHGT